MNEYEIN